MVLALNPYHLDLHSFRTGRERNGPRFTTYNNGNKEYVFHGGDVDDGNVIPGWHAAIVGVTLTTTGTVKIRGGHLLLVQAWIRNRNG